MLETLQSSFFILALKHFKVECPLLTPPITILDNGRYSPEGYSMLLNPDYWKSVHKISDCLSLCSFNQTCAAMSYDKRTSTCYMSGTPKFLNMPGVEPTAFLKEAHSSDFTLLQCGEKGSFS